MQFNLHSFSFYTTMFTLQGVNDYMNIVDKSVLKKIYELGRVSQRHLADVCGYSLGKINQSIQFLQNNEYIDSNWNLTDKSQVLIKSYKPRKAIILAAGFAYDGKMVRV